jgi:erythronate-4-phosphate dehydrogenase
VRIVVASSVLLGREAFADAGEVLWVPEAEITPAVVHDAEAVITRTKTRLGSALLAGSRVRFVATCTAGTDHLDLPWLAAQGITAASAPGCNAEGVAQWFTAAVLDLLENREAPRRVGIVGHGHVGRRVEAMARALGWEVRLNDPPRAEAGEPGYAPLAELLETCDLLTLHVPLEEGGAHPTRHLIGPAEIARLRRGAWLFNACRGEVLDGPAAAAARRAGHLAALALDVWDPEPDVPAAVLAAADLATAHIAGHSLEGRLNGTEMARAALDRHCGRPARWRWRDRVPPATQAAPDSERAVDWVRAVYRIAEDDRLLREACAAPDKIASFRRLRDQYRERREFASVTWTGTEGAPAPRPLLRGLGFQL